MPYNYLIDQKTQASITGLDLAGAIVIFDEAHNIESSCGDACSTDISSLDMISCLAEVSMVRDFIKTGMFAGSLSYAILDQCEKQIQRLLEALKSLPMNKERQLLRKGEFILEVFAMAGLFEDTARSAIQLIEQVARVYVEGTHQRRQQNIKSSLQLIASALRTVFAVRSDEDLSLVSSSITEKKTAAGIDSPIIDHRFFRVFAEEVFINVEGPLDKPPSQHRILSYWCFNPSVAMKELVGKRIHSLLLTSGTLSPLASFGVELGIDFKYQLENNHVVDSTQMFCQVVGTGPNGLLLNSSYSQRNSTEYKMELGESILQISRIVPNGILVFFPSYPLMETCLKTWQTRSKTNLKTIYEQLLALKTIFIEPKNKVDLIHVMRGYDRCIENNLGAIFFAVCRGKVSEGLDFSDAKCRAVIITGIPYPPFKDPRVLLKRQYLDDQAREVKSKDAVLTGDQWYIQQAARAVNQAIGRVIRHKKDYGAILLLDDRFGMPKTIAQLSKWIRPNVRISNTFGELCTLLEDFYAMQDVIKRNNPKHRVAQSIDAPLVYKIDDTIRKKTMDEIKAFFKPPDMPNACFVTENIPSSLTSKKVQSNENGKRIFIKAFGMTASDPPTEKSAKQLAQSFIDQISHKLSPSTQKLFTATIKQYRAGQLDIRRFIDSALDLFEENGADDLQDRFRMFISSKHHCLYDQLCKEHCKTQTFLNDVKESCDSSKTLISVQHLVDDFPLASKPKCPVCKETINDGYKAKCGHACCFVCWNSWLQIKLECPICKHRTRIPQLKKTVF